MYAILQNHIKAFSPITDEDWNLLLPHLEIKTIRKNELLIAEGKKALQVGFVIEGMFRQYYTRDGEEKTTYFFFENHFISSYISCITGKPSLITIEALSNATIISFPYKILQELFEKSMAWQKFGRLVAEYFTIGLEERMVSLLMQSPEVRYLELLRVIKKRL